jgi:hypothetical protein
MDSAHVGREKVREVANDFLAGAREGPRGLLVEGEAGIGKTAVWRAALDEAAAQRYRVLACVAEQAEARLSFAGLSDLLGGTLVTLRLRAARVSADGRVTVVVANANPFAVRATLSGATAKAVLVGRKRRRVALKARTVAVAPAASRAVTLRLPATLRSLLRRQGKLSLRLQVKVRDPAGTTRVVTKAVAPRLKRAR